MPGRFEVMRRNPMIVIDVAHNPEGAEVVTQTLRDDFGEGRPLVLVIGLLTGRDPLMMFDAFGANEAEAVICVTADSPRAYSADDLVVAAHSRGIDAEAVPDVTAAIERALAIASDDAVIFVTGTVYVVGAARTFLRRAS
jgi:dihydrofolate synthase/folylpolyglutamate synthase